LSVLKLTISTPDGNIFEGDIKGISLRGTEGDLAVLPGHIPFITAVKPCECHIELPDGSMNVCHTTGGILTVSGDTVTLLSGGMTLDLHHSDHTDHFDEIY